MSNSNLTKEENRLRHIAEQYKQRGYKVIISPPPQQLPGFLSRFSPDLVAEGPDDSVVVEIKSPGKTRGIAYWEELSKVVQQHPRWRLELVVNASSKRNLPENLNKELIKQRLLEGRRLAEEGMLAASLLITWSALEAAMRLAGKSHELDLPDPRPGTVISRLYTGGALEREEYDFLLDCLRIRDTVAHGFQEERVRRGLLRKLERIARRLSP